MQGVKPIPDMIAELPPKYDAGDPSNTKGIIKELDRALAEVELLKAALEKWQDWGHTASCGVYRSRRTCTCGYDDVQKALEAVK